MIKFYSTCIFLCAPFFISAQSTLLADSLFASGNFLRARVEYDRALFLGNKDISQLLLKKSYCLKAEGKYEDAYNALQSIDFFQGADSLKFNLYYESILNAYLAGKYDLSMNKIQELNYYLPGFFSPVIRLLEILTLNQQHHLAEAENKYKEFIKTNNLNEPDIYQNKKLKNPEKAESISHLLPGVGQMYAGYAGRGFTSMIIQAGLVAFTGYNFWYGYYFSGAFTGAGLFYMFNNGGARHAKYLAEKKNKETIEQLNREVQEVFSKAIKK